MAEEHSDKKRGQEYVAKFSKIVQDFGRKVDSPERYNDEYQNIPEDQLVAEIKNLQEKREKFDGYLGFPADTAIKEIDLRIEAIMNKLKISTVK